MITCAYCEDPQPVERDASCDGMPCHARPDSGKTREMHDDEGDCRRIDDIIVRAVEGCVL